MSAGMDGNHLMRLGSVRFASRGVAWSLFVIVSRRRQAWHWSIFEQVRHLDMGCSQTEQFGLYGLE
jgi:hypothetical protein